VIEGNARYAGHGLGRWPGSMRLLLWVGLVAWAAGCAPGSSGSSGAGVVSGSVTYGERMALPPDAVVEVTLSDVSVQDAAAPIIAQATVVAAGREVPLPFELRYDPKKIHPTGWYAMRAAIRREGRLIFTSDTVYRVITHGNPTQVDLHLVRVGDGADSRSGGAARVEAIRADLASYRAVQGTGAAGDDGAAWIAYFDGAALRCIDETSGQGHDGTAENEYYFESGKLVAYVSRETRAVTDPGRPAGEERVTLRLAFDPSGAEAELSKTVDGRPAPIDGSEIAAVRTRAALLAAEAARAAAQPAPSPPSGGTPQDPSS
jgi:putative lipoprotein